MTKQKNTKVQHHLPQMLLKRFCDDTDRLYMLDKKNEKIPDPRSTESVGYVNHLYTIDNGVEKNICIETAFSKHESNASNLLDKLLSRKCNYTSKDATDLIQFISCLWIRCPKWVKMTENLSTNTDFQENLEARAIKERIEKSDFDMYIESINTAKGQAYANTLDYLVNDSYDKLTNNFTAYICFYDEGNLVLNDNYAIYEPCGNVTVSENWYDLPIKVHFPLSSKCTLTFVSNKLLTNDINTDGFVFNICTVENSIDYISKLNALSYEYSERYVYCELENILKDFNVSVLTPQLQPHTNTKA